MILEMMVRARARPSISCLLGTDRAASSRMTGLEQDYPKIKYGYLFVLRAMDSGTQAKRAIICCPRKERSAPAGMELVGVA